MSEPLITVVVPVHNRAEVLERTLLSISAQTYRPLRVIIVDNNSTDAVPQMLRKWAEAHRSVDFGVTIIKETTPGASSARNAGLALVESPWTLFFDSDDTMSAGHIQRIAEAIEANPDIDLFGWDTELHLLDGSVVVKPFEERNLLYNCVMHGTLATQRYIARTELFRKAGGWDETVMVWNDIEMGVRLSLQSPKVMKLKGEPMVQVYSMATSITGDSFLRNAEHRIFAIDCMLHTLPENLRYIAYLKSIILAANIYRESTITNNQYGISTAKALYNQVLSDIRSRRRRILLTLAYNYTKAGGRGAAQLLMHLL